jgi:hypothetical protein
MTRQPSGTTITELIVASILLAYVFAVVGELVVATTFANTRLTNCVDGVNGANLFLRHLSEDVRTAQTFGSIYSLPQNANYFPDTANPNDVSAALVPFWGGWPTSWPTIPYQLRPKCLVLQQPAFYGNPQNPSTSPLEGAPLIIPQKSFSTTNPKMNIQYVDTVVYYVLPDPQSPGQFMIQRARFSGYLPPTFSPSDTQLRQLINPPQTVLRGVVGPLNSSDPTDSTTPAVFQYLFPQKSPPPPPYFGQVAIPSADQVESLVGVSVNVEVETPIPSNGSKIHHVGCHAEAFLRANSHIKLSNT